MQLAITKKQQQFVDASQQEVLFGGAAGGGKSYAQVIDAFLYALKYAGSKQLILRRTYPELEKSIIRQSLALYPKEIYKYHSSTHTGIFSNGSLIDFGYCDSEKDVYRYQSAEFDVIRFDELTHFEKEIYIYLLSRLRGANAFPKQVKSCTNPGGVGHKWVKERFIDIGPASTAINFAHGSRLFLPATVTENKFLMEKDPDYIKRLENLSEKDKKALLYGRWDIFEGQYFDEWDPQLHVVAPFEIPTDWKRYISIDYGLDMFAAYFIALDLQNNAWVYKEIYQPNLIISSAAQLLNSHIKEKIQAFYAPADLWNRRQESGASVVQLFAQQGLHFTKALNQRVAGWYAVKEFLKPVGNQEKKIEPRLKVFHNCINLIRTLPALCHDSKNPNDVSPTPHEYTHAPDALRYFCSMHSTKNVSDCIYLPTEAQAFINLTR